MSQLRELQNHVHTLRQENELLRKRVDVLEAVLGRVAKLEETHESWDDAVFDAMKWAREALKESEER